MTISITITSAFNSAQIVSNGFGSYGLLVTPDTSYPSCDLVITLTPQTGLIIQAANLQATSGPAPTILNQASNSAGVWTTTISGHPSSGVGWGAYGSLALSPGFLTLKTFQIQAQFVNRGTGFIYDTASCTITYIGVQSLSNAAPSNPTGVSLQAIGSKVIRVSANIPPIANQYTIAVFQGSTNLGSFVYYGNGPIVKDFGPTSPTVSAGLPYSIAIACTITAFNVSSGVVASNIATTPLAPPVPAVVTNYVGTGLDFARTQIVWTAAPTLASGVTSYPNTYTIKRSTTSGGTFVTAGVTTGNSFIDGAGAFLLTVNTTYYYKITSSSESGTGGTTPEFTAKTLQIPGTPSALTSFSAVVSNHSDITLTLVYPIGQPAQGFKILRGTAAAGPFVEIATLPGSAGTSISTQSYLDAGLATATTYYYQAYAVNTNAGLVGATSSTSVTTDAAPATPGIPTGVAAATIDDASILLFWTGVAPLTELSFYIYRSTSSGGTFVQVGTASVGATSYTDTGLNPNATYYYKLKAHGYSADSAFTSEVNATTNRRSTTLLPQCPIYLTKGFVGIPRQAGGREIFPSNLDRGIVHDGGNWYPWGLKPFLTAPVLEATGSGGVLAAGTYWIYIVLYDSRREIRSPVYFGSPTEQKSNQITITLGQKLRITPPLQADNLNVKCRDVAYDSSRTAILACDYWEVYVATGSIGNAYLVATLPMAVASWEDAGGSKKYTIDGTLTYTSIFGGDRRPLEQQLENSLPPAVSYLGVKRNRVVAFGETNIVPTSDDQAAGSAMVIASGGHTVTFSSFTISDAAIYKEIFINGTGTQWEIYDVEGTTAYIRHQTDPKLNISGFPGAGGTFHDFALGVDQSRVYFSAWYSGNALKGLVYNPEAFPPLTHYSYEFFPEDNTDPNGIKEVGDAIMLGKPSKWLYITGGDEPDFPILDVQVVSRGSGLNSAETMCLNRNDILYFLGDSGLHRVRSSGVEKVVDYTGNAHMLQDIFDLASIDSAIAEWFSREDYYVCCGLNRIGNAGNRDGFIYDERNNLMFWFSTDRKITAMKEVKNTSGEYQLMIGDGFGNIGIFLKVNSTVDGVNFTQPNPFASMVGISGYIRSGLIDSDHAFTFVWFQPRIQSSPSGIDIACEILIDPKNRMDDPNQFVPTIRIPVSTTDTRDHFSCGGNRCQQGQVQFGFTTPAVQPSAQIAFRELPFRIQSRGRSN